MSSTSKKQLSDLFTLIVLVLTTFQGLIPAMPITNQGTITLISAVMMFLVTGFTAWKQYLSNEISNEAMGPTLFVALIATMGGLNDLFSLVPLGAVASQWIRFSITAITMILNLASKTIWPTGNGNDSNVQYKARL